MLTSHPLQRPSVVREIERAASSHLGRRWTALGFTDLNERASHPCGLVHGESFSVFAKLDPGADGSEQFAAELLGLNLLRDRAHVPTPAPVASGLVEVDAGWLLLLEAIREVPAPLAHQISGSPSAAPWPWPTMCMAPDSALTSSMALYR